MPRPRSCGAPRATPPSLSGYATSLALARRGARARRGRTSSARGRRARRRRHHGRRLRRSLDGDPHQATRARRATSWCSSRTSAAVVRAVATAASRSRGGPSWGRSSSCAARDGALAIAHAADSAVAEIAAFCDEHGIDAHYHRGGHLWTATSQAQLGAWDGVMATCRELGVMPFEEWTPEQTARTQRIGSSHRRHVRALGRDPPARAAGARAPPRGARARRAHPRGHARSRSSIAARRPCSTRRSA